jgi:hypothetical protein
LEELGDGGVATSALDLDGLDLVQTGVEIAVYDKLVSQVPIARATLKRAVSRRELCEGLVITELEEPGPLRRIVLYLDPLVDASGPRCPRGSSAAP